MHLNYSGDLRTKILLLSRPSSFRESEPAVRWRSIKLNRLTVRVQFVFGIDFRRVGSSIKWANKLSNYSKADCTVSVPGRCLYLVATVSGTELHCPYADEPNVVSIIVRWGPGVQRSALSARHERSITDRTELSYRGYSIDTISAVSRMTLLQQSCAAE